jgi:hypothetical protein
MKLIQFLNEEAADDFDLASRSATETRENKIDERTEELEAKLKKDIGDMSFGKISERMDTIFTGLFEGTLLMHVESDRTTAEMNHSIKEIETEILKSYKKAVQNVRARVRFK